MVQVKVLVLLILKIVITLHDDLFGLQSPGSPVTHHRALTNSKVLLLLIMIALWSYQAGLNAQQPGSVNALNSMVQQTGVLGQFPADVIHNTIHEDG